VYEQILQMAPGLSWIHATLADLYLTQDRIDLARAAARSYAEAEPERAAGQLGLARLAMQASDWEAARPAIDRAALLEPELVGPLLLEAELEVMQGQFDAGERAIERALATVREPGQEVEVRCRHAVLLQFQQRFAEALVQADRCAELGRAAFPPVQWVMDLQLPFSGLRARINGLPATLTAIDAELAGFDQSFRDIGCYGRMLASLEGGDGDLARQELVLFERVMVGSNRSDLDFFTAYGRGRLAWLEGDAQAAASALAESLALFQRSLHAGKGAQRFLDIHLSSLELRLRALIQTGADAAAIELASAAIKRFPGSAPLQTAAAEALLAGGRIEAARAALADARRLWANADPDAVPTDRLQGLQAALAG
jgi:predicted Zn-dependent protease